jgi:hypothetical protein
MLKQDVVSLAFSLVFSQIAQASQLDVMSCIVKPDGSPIVSARQLLVAFPTK